MFLEFFYGNVLVARNSKINNLTLCLLLVDTNCLVACALFIFVIFLDWLRFVCVCVCDTCHCILSDTPYTVTSGHRSQRCHGVFYIDFYFLYWLFSLQSLLSGASSALSIQYVMLLTRRASFWAAHKRLYVSSYEFPSFQPFATISIISAFCSSQELIVKSFLFQFNQTLFFHLLAILNIYELFKL